MKLEFGTLSISGFKAFLRPQQINFGAYTPGVHFIRGVNNRVRRPESNGCLLGNTLIDCPRNLLEYPKGIPIKELVRRKDFWTYSWDFERDTLTLAKVNRVWRTGKKKVCKVTFSAYPKGKTKLGKREGGTQQGKYLPPCELVGTYDHPVLLCDGTWKKLGELQLGDSIKSLYRREADRGKLSWSRKVQTKLQKVGVQNAKTAVTYYGLTKTISEQQFVCETAHGLRPKGTHAHHKDNNKYNHSVDNLEWKNAHQHIVDHNKERCSQRSPVANHEVVAIEHVGKRHVYDMEVERTHNFVANGVFVHNSAKSTIFDAASWCLFGRTVEGLRNPDVVPWADPKVTTDVAWCIKIDGELHTIWRTANPNNLSIDDEKVSQEHVEALIRLSPEVFNHAILLGQDQNLFFDLGASKKMELFSEVLHLDRWLERSTVASKIVTRMETKKQELEMMGGSITNSIEEFERMVKSLQAKSEEWRAQRKEELAAIEKHMADLKEGLAKKQVLKDNADLALDSAGTEADASARELQTANTNLLAATRSYDKAASILKQKRDLLKQLGEANVCPTCGQDIKGTDLGKHKRELKQQIAASQKLETTAIEAFRLAQDRKEALQEQWDDFSKKARDAQAFANLHGPDVTKMETELRGLNAELAKSGDNHDPYREQSVDMKRKIRAMEEERAAVYTDLNLLAKRITRTQFWVKGFKEVRLFKISEVLQELQMVSNNILADVGLEDWELSYDVEKETKSGTIQRGINVFIQSPDSGRPVRWEGWSGGERQRLRLIGALALGEVLLGHAGVQPSMVVLDEPTRNLSDEGVDDLCRLLADRAKELGLRFFMIDHMAQPSSHFASTITVRKGQDGTSEILT